MIYIYIQINFGARNRNILLTFSKKRKKKKKYCLDVYLRFMLESLETSERDILRRK